MAKPLRSASRLDRAFHVLRAVDGLSFTRHVDPDHGPVLAGVTPDGVPVTMTDTEDGLALSTAYAFTPEALVTPDRCALFAHACTREAFATRFVHQDDLLLVASHYAGGVNADDLLFWVDAFADEALLPEDLDRDNTPPLLQADDPSDEDEREASGEAGETASA